MVDNYIKIQCKALIENEVMLRYMVGMFISKANPTMNEITEVKTLLSEAVVNAIIHGYEGIQDGLIDIELRLENQTLMMDIKDNGCGIDSLEEAKQPLFTTKPELERSGMGMTIMESLADEFEIISKPSQGCHVHLVKKFRGLL